MAIFKHVPHPHIKARQDQLPVTVDDQHGEGFNGRVALSVTKGVGTMWCAYIFSIIALIGLPSAIQQATSGGGLLPVVQWIAQTFFQLVLLSVILVGQDVQGRASDKRAQQTYDDAEAVLHECLQIQQHLEAQDAALTKLLNPTKDVSA